MLMVSASWAVAGPVAARAPNIRAFRTGLAMGHPICLMQPVCLTMTEVGGMSSMGPDGNFSRTILRAVMALAVAGTGLLLIVGALAANQDWLDRHFLPLFF